MTREQVAAIMPVMQAWLDGKPIQKRLLHPAEEEWHDVVGDDTAFGTYAEWRIKPTPREWWLVLGTAGLVVEATPDPDEAQRIAAEADHRRVVAVREVLL